MAQGEGAIYSCASSTRALVLPRLLHDGSVSGRRCTCPTGAAVCPAGVARGGPARRRGAAFAAVQGLLGPGQSVAAARLHGALGRLESIESSRSCAPGEWGQRLGRDRVPEVRTLRAKIRLLAQADAPGPWSAALCERWTVAAPERAGVLDIDGHVRVCHGTQTSLPRHYVARQRLCLRATTEPGTCLRNGWWVRERRKRRDRGHQTAILCANYRCGAAPLAGAMFARWSQENFFKHARKRFGLDRLIEDRTEAISDPLRIVDPDYRHLDGKVRSATGTLTRPTE